LGGFWLLNHWRRPETQIGTDVTGEASRAITDNTDYVRRTIPDKPELNLPRNAAAYQLLRVIRGERTGGWLSLDGLTFDTGSATLKSGYSAQLDNVATVLKAYPDAKITIGGFTDNVGSADSNMALSRARAKTVREELISRGIAPDRLMSEGYGEKHAMASNETSIGRAQNRRVSLQVAQR